MSDDKELMESANQTDLTSSGSARPAESREDDKKRSKKNTQRPIIEFTPLVDEDGNRVVTSPRKPKRKVAVMIGYCGTGYNGLQVQNDENVKTIEQDIYTAMIEAGAISKENAMDLKKSGFQRAARTDKGVHAAGNVISLKMIIEDPDIMKKINDHLPKQIRVWGIQRTTKGFDCRKCCSSRVYEYLLPTFSLLPPKPKTALSKLINEKRSKSPELFVNEKDVEGDDWWKAVEKKIFDIGITQEQLDSIGVIPVEEGEEPTTEEPQEDESTTTSSLSYTKLIKKIKNIENQSRREYRVSQTRLDEFRQAMKQYEGTHNFHNFTIGKPFKDTSAKRYMISTNVSDPFVIEGTEWISIKIHGQSFMLHQIRKMIAMAALITRLSLPPALIQTFFTEKKINIPKAPALGLLLENPVYDGYNPKLVSLGYDEVDFSKYEKEMLDFKMKNIYDKIYADELKENTFYAFFGYIDSYKTNVIDDGEAVKKDNSVFDFITNYNEKIVLDNQEPEKEEK